MPVSWFGWEDASSWDIMDPFPTCHHHLECQPAFAASFLLFPESWGLRKPNRRWKAVVGRSTLETLTGFGRLYPLLLGNLPTKWHEHPRVKSVCCHQVPPSSWETAGHCSKESSKISWMDFFFFFLEGNFNSFLYSLSRQGSQRIEDNPNEPACKASLLD